MYNLFLRFSTKRVLFEFYKRKIVNIKRKILGVDMATVVRLTRMGRKKKPFYRIVVTDSRKRRDGGWIESIGYYNPLTEPETIKVDKERLDYWKSVGAKLSDRVERITK